MAVYIRLFHARKDPNEDLDDWGFDGPVFGPYDWAHTTYAMHLKLGRKDGTLHELFVDEDMLYYGGAWYGDWSVFSDLSEDAAPSVYDKEKAVIPERLPETPEKSGEECPDLSGDHVACLMEFINRVGRGNGQEYVRDVYFCDADEGCIPDAYIGDDLLADIREKFSYPLWAMAEKAAVESGINASELEVVIDPSYEDRTTFLVRLRDTGRELYYDSAKAWHFRFDGREDFNAFLREV